MQVRLYRPFAGEAFRRRSAAGLPGARRDRADQGAGRARRAALSRCRGRRWRRRSPAARGTTMPRVIGGRYGLASKDFNPAHGQGCVRRAGKARARRTASPSASTTMSPTRASPIDPQLHDRAARGRAGGLLRARRGRHGRRQQEQRQDHRRRRRDSTRRAISSTIRTNRGRRRSRTCASGRGRSVRPI